VTHGRLRSQSWFGRNDRQGYEHRSFLRALGLPDHVFDGRPVIGICSLWSELNPCDANHRDLARHAREGVIEAGGLPLEFSGLAIGEPLMRPSPMLYRNLASMVLEEVARANPLDGLVLLAGCDKGTPALLMGAASVDLPCVLVSSGPKMSAHHRGETIGSGTHIWRIENSLGAGQLPLHARAESEAAMSRSVGTCMTMGTASTMAALAEAVGLALPGNATIPATDARRAALARASGAVAVDAVRNERRPSTLLSRASFLNAVRVTAAIGGSSNAILHMLALARRAEISFTLDDWDREGRGVPCLVDLMPAGRFLMEDFFAAGGLSALLADLATSGHYQADIPAIEGGLLSDRLVAAPCFDRRVIRPLSDPVVADGGMVVLKGNIAPDGAVLKQSAATPSLMRHVGRAIVFDSIEAYKAGIDDPALMIRPSDVLVLRNCGPAGYPGMPEVGNLKLPDRLVAEGVTDMVRISDARMSGTAYGTVILHVAPEAAVGGPLSRLRSGDLIRLDVAQRRLDAEFTSDELSQPNPVAANSGRGFAQLYRRHVLQAQHGADFDFLVGRAPADVPRDST
jgi:dihydroxy-acid dehydratase